MIMKRLFLAFTILTLLVTFSAIPQDVFADTYTVKTVQGSGAPGCETKGGCYSPMVLTISKGDSVKFINTDSAAHTYTSGHGDSGPDGVFDSGLVMAMGDFSFKLSDAGTYDYFCMVHPWMTGEIIVKSSGSSTPSTPTTPPYNPPTSSGTDWQGKYLEVLSDFNEVSSRAGELQRENDDLKQQVRDLQKTVDDLNAVLMEQVKVIYDWVLGK
jgi:plastocyanin